MEVEQVELTSKQVASIFDVSPITVSAWVRRRGLKARLPYGSRRKGLRIKVRDVRAFIPTIAGDDTSMLLSQLDQWLTQHQEELVTENTGARNRTHVLLSEDSAAPVKGTGGKRAKT